MRLKVLTDIDKPAIKPRLRPRDRVVDVHLVIIAHARRLAEAVGRSVTARANQHVIAVNIPGAVDVVGPRHRRGHQPEIIEANAASYAGSARFGHAAKMSVGRIARCRLRPRVAILKPANEG